MKDDCPARPFLATGGIDRPADIAESAVREAHGKRPGIHRVLPRIPMHGLCLGRRVASQGISHAKSRVALRRECLWANCRKGHGHHVSRLSRESASYKGNYCWRESIFEMGAPWALKAAGQTCSRTPQESMVSSSCIAPFTKATMICRFIGFPATA